MGNRDLFEELKRIVRCEYISDLRYSPWKEKGREAIVRMNLSEYTMFALEDAAEYLYGEKASFAGSGEAQEYFRKRARNAC